MSILIKGMEMPFAGSIKTIVIYPDGTVRTRQQDPLPYTAVPIPPHGRLIDADALEQDISESVVFSGRGQNAELIGAKKIISRLHCAPTIISADPGEEETT